MAKISIDMKSGGIVRDQDTIIGIDLGTTNSLVAYTTDGQPKAVRGADGERTLMPSVVHFAEDNRILVGDEAKEKLISDPLRTIFSVKRLMGKSYKDVADIKSILGYQIIDEDTESLVKIRVGDTFYNPIELSAIILRSLKARIEKNLGKEVSKAVITVPAYFNDNQRQATRDAGRMAGLDVLRIVNEPTAASLAYGIGLDREKTETIAVYDLGGGTFDISILRIEDGIFEVLATNGDTFLGGDDFDRVLVEFWMEKLGLDFKTIQANGTLAQTLRLAAEEAKKTLSTEQYFSTKIMDKTVEITRSDFEALISTLIEKTIFACKNALKDAETGISDIDKVVLVGGSTRVPAVRKAVAELFQKEAVEGVNPDEVVALGAAIQADILAGNQKDLLLLDVTPLSLGIETVGGLMDVIIPRNNKVPSKAGRQYTTSVDGQKNLKVAVFQGERDLVEHNRKLGEFILKGIPPMPAGLPKIDIQFIINADGILTVRARELRSDLEQQIDIRPSYGISEEEMGRMLLDSIQNAEADMKIRSLLEARNEANNILLSGQKFIKQNEAILSAEEMETTIDLLATLQQATEGDDKDAIHAAMETLNDYTAPLAHRALDVNIGKAMKGQSLEAKL